MSGMRLDPRLKVNALFLPGCRKMSDSLLRGSSLENLGTGPGQGKAYSGDAGQRDHASWNFPRDEKRP